MTKVVLIHYGEIGLKKGNRREFEKKLINNIAEKLAISTQEVTLANKYLILPLPRQRSEKIVSRKLREVFGIAWFAIARKVEPEIGVIKKETKTLAKQISQKDTFAVRVKRVDKKFPLSSIKAEKILGQIIVDQTRAKVDLVSPDKTFFVEVDQKSAFLFFNKTPGLGGLPVGTAGKVLVLFSGGIDSPAAAWLMAKRGVEADLIHFSALNPKQTAKSKIKKVYKELKKYLGESRLIIVPYIYFQLAVSNLPKEFIRYEVLLFRRFMLKTASLLAEKENYQALVLGDNLSQVASQTLDNLAVTDKDQDLPIFRPLLGYDKQEIISLAKRIGTYKPSIEKYKDCCSLLHKQPVIKGVWEILSRAEKQLKLDELVNISLKEMFVIS